MEDDDEADIWFRAGTDTDMDEGNRTDSRRVKIAKKNNYPE